MKLFFDTEFTGLHQFTNLISIGIVAENGKTFYAEITDYDPLQIEDWLKENVIDNLILKDGNDFVHVMYEDHTFVKTTFAELNAHLSHWLTQFQEVQIWSDCLAYDWVLFCQIFGGAFKVPKNIYYIPFDICPLLLEKVSDADINREKYAGDFKMPIFIFRMLENKKHNSLWDAYVIMACYNKVTSKKQD